MNHNLPLGRSLLRAMPDLLRGGFALLLGVGCALLIAQVLIAPTAGDMRTLAGYLTLSGAATIGGGWLVSRAVDRVVGLGIQTKSLCAALTGTAVALLNVLIVAQLMFVSTSHDLRLLVALIGFSAVVTVLFTLWVASNTASRVATIASGVRLLASGQYRERIGISGRDEVTALATDINVLAARLEAMEEQRTLLDAERRELTASISHDLRTPLASVRAMVEALDDRVVEDSAEVKRYYVTMRREIDRLSRMIDDLFELAQIDAGALRLNVQPVSIAEVAAEVVDAMQAQALQRDIALSIDVGARPAELAVDGSRIERAVANLVRNALEHTPGGGSVTVSVATEPGWVLVRVSDTGDGIAPEDLPNIWTRFYRADKSRGRLPGSSSDGAGLGLAITRGIIESHGGVIEAASERGRGTTILARLPAGTVAADDRSGERMVAQRA